MIIVCHDYEEAGSLVALGSCVEGWVTGLEVHSSVGGARPGQEAWVVGFWGDVSLLIVTPG